MRKIQFTSLTLASATFVVCRSAIRMDRKISVTDFEFAGTLRGSLLEFSECIDETRTRG